MGRILGLDVGEKRIGVAISSPEGTLAVPLRILESSGDEADIDAIGALARSEGATTLVVGHPVSLAGGSGPQARRVEAFARRLAESSGLVTELWDERLTTAQARRSPARSQGRGPRHRARTGRGRPADDVAAAILLQSYLDRHRPEASAR